MPKGTFRVISFQRAFTHPISSSNERERIKIKMVRWCHCWEAAASAQRKIKIMMPLSLCPRPIFFNYYTSLGMLLYILSIKLIKHAKNINLNMLIIIRTLNKILCKMGGKYWYIFRSSLVVEFWHWCVHLWRPHTWVAHWNVEELAEFEKSL